MINLAFLKANKWVLIIGAFVFLLLIGGILGKLDSLIHPNTDKEEAKISKAVKVQIDNVVNVNTQMQRTIDEQVESNKINSEAVIKFVKTETDQKDKLTVIKNKLISKNIETSVADKASDINISSIVSDDTKDSSKFKLLVSKIKKKKKIDDISATDDIDSIYEVFGVVTKETK